jgi:hypothetical protein
MHTRAAPCWAQCVNPPSCHLIQTPTSRYFTITVHLKASGRLPSPIHSRQQAAKA